MGTFEWIQWILGLSALILSVVNGIALFKYYLRDKPKLVVYPVHPDIYQWWFKLPDGKYEGKITRKYGFLIYIDVINKGFRKVAISWWKLFLNTKEGKEIELKPISISEPLIKLSVGTKSIPVLGLKGPLFEGSTLVDSGCVLSGMAYYVAEFYTEEDWSPEVKDGKIVGKIVVCDVFGKKAQTRVEFSEKPLEDVKAMIKGIEAII